MLVDGTPFRTVWLEGSTVKLIDQPALPHAFAIVDMPTHRHTADAIRTMIVRGAGAIGATGAFGMAQAALEAPERGFHAYIADAARTLESTRPTAQNLFYGIRSVLSAIEGQGDQVSQARQAAVAAARRAIEVAPHVAAAHLALADALFPEGVKPDDRQLAEAERHVRAALALAPDNASAHNELGRIAMARGEHFAAAAALASSVVTDPRQDAPLANLSMVFGQLVGRAHYVVFVLWLVGRFTITKTTFERSALWILEGVGLAVLGWTAVQLRWAAGGIRARILLREFARRDPIGAAWGGALAIGALGFLVMGLTPEAVTRALVPIVGGCLVVGMVLSWVRVSWFRRRQRG